MLSLAFLALASIAILVEALSSSTNCVSTSSESGSIPLVSSGKAAPLFFSTDEWPGVSRAASDFSADIQRVTGATPKLNNITSTSSINSKNGVPIIIGTLGHSSLIDSVISHSGTAGQSFSALNGTWESFHAQIVSNPLPGVDKAYVIVGADKRGTIFALYELSEQAGVSPWFWWADVPIRTSKSLSLTSTPCSHGEPSVKYRGIFLNDEQPALQNWAQEKFTNNFGGAGAGQAVDGDPTFGANGDPTAPGSGTNAAFPFNRFFYTKLFELILRLKGNYLWPAQWSSAFGIDDSHNQFLADLYGIVMGTSHEEPMMRSIPVEWNDFGSGPWNFSTNAANITAFWVNGTERAHGFDEIYTVGMRGDGDLPLSETTNIDLLEQIVAVQRGILSQVYNVTDVSTIPQMWALYKEVQGYYEDGMRVEDDITLLWTDDNWGNIRRFPLADERNRSGGAGVYYHIDYVGDPRDYKWIQSSPISKTFEQLSLAYNRDAKTIWVLNVGDLKPYEMSTEFFLTYGYNATRWTPSNLNTFTELWATREFGLPNKAAEIADIVNNVTRWNMRRKPELLNSTTYSLINYREADNVLAAWNATIASSTAIYNSLPSATKPSFFQLVHHPVLASANLQKLWITAGKNNLYGSQARLSTNDLADQVEELFETDYDLEEEYHALLDGKWDHIMDQTHINYAYWQQPMQNTMPPVTRVPTKKQALPGPMRIALEGSDGAWPGDDMFDCAQEYSCSPPTLPTLDSFNPVQSRWVDISAGGPNTFSFNATSNVTWLHITPSQGTITTSNKEQRLELSVDWNSVSDTEFASIVFSATAKGQPVESQQVFFVASKTSIPADFKGFVEGDGTITFEAAHATRNTSVNGVAWTEIPNYGRTLSGVTPLPALGNNDANFSVGAGPTLEYDFYNFNTLPGGNVSVDVLVSPSLNGYDNSRPLGFATQIDSDTPQAQYFIPIAAPGDLPDGWDGNDGFVANSIVSVVSQHSAAPGAHTLKIWMIEPAVVVQKIVIDTGGVQPSYLGPPESVRV
ncbi:glycoside hydrolase family 115 protein [Ramaria rubella]|nr:glycoside hydrolase family 115 protein [Ramaria rubella]